MFIDVRDDDIAEALMRFAQLWTPEHRFLHSRYNPIATAIERKFPSCYVVVTYDKLHIYGRDLTLFRDTTLVARNYLKAFVERAVTPVQRMAIC